MELVPCVGCKRHVAAAETSCPFCAVALPRQRVQLAMPRGRITRAAIFSAAALVACQSKQSPPQPAPAPAQGSDDLEKMLDVDQHVVDHPAAIDAGSTLADATALATAEDGGVGSDAGVDQAALEAKKRRNEQVLQMQREKQKRLEKQRVETMRMNAKPYGAPPARRRLV